MCTIAFANFNAPAKQVLDAMIVRSRDGWGFITNESDDVVKIDDYSEFCKEVFNSVMSCRKFVWMLMHGRAAPESEPDFLKPSTENCQPVKVNDRWFYAFHGLINNLDELDPDYDDNKVDTFVIKNLILKYMNNENDNLQSFKEMVNKIRGSFVIFLVDKLKGVLYVASNFLSVFYGPSYVTTVPISEYDVILQPYTAYKISTIDCCILEKTSLYDYNNDWVVVCSSGLDSTTVLSLVKILYPSSRITVVHYSYGQDSQNEEYKAIENICEYMNVLLINLNAQDLFSTIDKKSLLFKSVADIPSLLDMERDVHYVSMRNSIFAITAAGIAESLNCNNLALGVNLTEGLVYVDNGNRWFYSMRELLKTAGRFPIRLKAPLLNLLKKEIIYLGHLSGAPYHLTVSCYHPKDGKACGLCGSCTNRIRAFMSAGFRDPIEYNQLPDIVDQEYYKKLPVYQPNPDTDKLKSIIQKWKIDV